MLCHAVFARRRKILLVGLEYALSIYCDASAIAKRTVFRPFPEHPAKGPRFCLFPSLSASYIPVLHGEVGAAGRRHSCIIVYKRPSLRLHKSPQRYAAAASWYRSVSKRLWKTRVALSCAERRACPRNARRPPKKATHKVRSRMRGLPLWLCAYRRSSGQIPAH